jgi:ribose transport system ATP-binding protein
MEECVLKVTGITKVFPGVVALDNIDFELRKGEVHVLLGENGAGKSTFIKILSGAYRNDKSKVFKEDKGSIFLSGKEVEIENPLKAIHLGIATCYQETNLVPYLTISENMYLGRFIKASKGIPIIVTKKMEKESQKVLDSIGIKLDVRKKISELGVAEKQMVEIAKALLMKAKIYILDEPTAVLSTREIDELFRVINSLKASGCSIIYISHRLEELPVIGDRVTVFRDGKKIVTTDVKNTTVDNLIELMVGRKIEETFPKIELKVGRELLRVEGLSKTKVFDNISLKLCEGEIVGIAGLVGSKRTEVARAIFGADKSSKGKVFISGEEIPKLTPRKAVNKGLCYLSEDRKALGLVLGMSVRDNIALPSIFKHTKFGVINDSYLQSNSENYIDKLGIKTPSSRQLVKNLSGGNQQKIVIAKWLATGCKVFLFDEPTRGIDVKAKAEVYSLMNDIIKAGAGIIMISSEMPEIINMCDRVYVMNNGKIRAEINKDELSQENVLKNAFVND